MAVPPYACAGAQQKHITASRTSRLLQVSRWMVQSTCAITTCGSEAYASPSSFHVGASRLQWPATNAAASQAACNGSNHRGGLRGKNAQT